MAVLLFIVAAILIAFGIYWSYQQRAKRLQAMTALAGHLGWSFDTDRDSSHDDAYSQFSVFRQGHSRYAFDTLRGNMNVGERAWQAQMGDYHYQVTSSNGKTTTTTTHIFSYLLVHLPYDRIPALAIRREGVFDKLAGALGFDDIDFESEEFSRKFHVKSGDKRFAYDVLHPRMMEFMLESESPALEIEDGVCCITGRGKRWTSDEFLARLEWAQAFFGNWPRHVTADLESRRATI